MTTKQEKLQMWLAAVLTAGEWTIAIYVLVHQGEIVMIYLAITYAIRETSGGKHYHEILIEAIQKARRKH
jgi:hypothetical protein